MIDMRQNYDLRGRVQPEAANVIGRVVAVDDHPARADDPDPAHRDAPAEGVAVGGVAPAHRRRVARRGRARTWVQRRSPGVPLTEPSSSPGRVSPGCRSSRGTSDHVAPSEEDSTRRTSVSSVSATRSKPSRAPAAGTASGTDSVGVASRAGRWVSHATWLAARRDRQRPAQAAGPLLAGDVDAPPRPRGVDAVGEQDRERAGGEVDDDRRAGVAGVARRPRSAEGVHVPGLVELEAETVVVPGEGLVEVRDEQRRRSCGRGSGRRGRCRR